MASLFEGRINGKYSSSFTRNIVILFLFITCLFCFGTLNATEVTEQEAEQVCTNWLARIVYGHGDWAKSFTPEIDEMHELWHNGLFLGRYYTIKPKGFVLLPALKEMQPVKAYSDESNLDSSQESGFLLMIKEVLYDRIQVLDNLGQNDAKSDSEEEMNSILQNQRQLWEFYTQPVDRFNSALPIMPLLEEAGPLTVSSWHQRAPYNDYCPHDGIDVCVVGCTATAMAQLLKFWQWPVYGNGSHSYTWDNMRCGNNGPAVELSADFSDEYDWTNIVDSCDLGCTPEQEAALAELNYEVGVAIEMNYGSCGSAAGYSTFALINYFRYSPLLYREDRTDHDLAGWFNIIRSEIDNGRPLLYSINMHSIICDGYRDHGNGQYGYHMNYGWGNTFSAWYMLDNLYCGWVIGDICPADQDGLIANIEPQSTPYIWLVSNDVDDSEGNNNGHADINESVSINMIIGNMGMEATNVSGNLFSDDPNIDITTSTTSFAGPIPRDGYSSSQTPFVLSIDPACPDPHISLLEIEITADGGYTATDNLHLFIGSTPGFADDMENGKGFWRHTVIVPGFSEQWHLESYRAHSGITSWKAGRSGELNYSNYQDACLITPPFLLPESAELTFWHWMEAETGSSTTAWDGGAVFISQQDGQWFQIFPEGGYPYTIIENPANPLGAETPCYSGIHDWTQEIFDLSMYSGVVQIMFRFGIDGAVTEEGWYIDDVKIKVQHICGDANDDREINVGDVVYLVNLIFHNGPVTDPEVAGDVNCDGRVNVGDVVYLANYVFQDDAPGPCAANN